MLYNKRCRSLKKYMRDFCDMVKREFPYITVKDYPKIKFYREKCCVPAEWVPEESREIIQKTREGRLYIDGYYEHGVIEIYNITKRKPEDLRETVRHECLHFLLEKSGLPFKDDEEVFLRFAIVYNANPYLSPGVLEFLKKGVTYHFEGIGHTITGIESDQEAQQIAADYEATCYKITPAGRVLIYDPKATRGHQEAGRGSFILPART